MHAFGNEQRSKRVSVLEDAEDILELKSILLLLAQSRAVASHLDIKGKQRENAGTPLSFCSFLTKCDLLFEYVTMI